MSLSKAIYNQWCDKIDAEVPEEKQELKEKKLKQFAARWSMRMRRKGREHQLCFD
jgi:hypothetical protein